MRAWKWIGLAGIVGVAAAGAVVGVRAQRKRRAFDDLDPDELRDRLHARLAAASG